MLAARLPDTLASLLVTFAPCFNVRTLATFQALVPGFLTHPGPRTITGMLTGARLAGRRHHDLAYRFFARARWCPDRLGLTTCDLICRLLAPTGALTLAVDDTLWRRSGRHLHGAAWAPRQRWPHPPPARLGHHHQPADDLPARLPARPGPPVAPW